MKSLVLALILFAIVVYGCHDVKPWRPIKRTLRRIPGRGTAPLQHGGNAVLRERVGGADAGQHQELRRAERPGRQHHFATTTRAARHTVLAPAHAHRAPAFEDQTFGHAGGFEAQVRTAERRLEERARSGPSPSTPLVHLKIG